MEARRGGDPFSRTGVREGGKDGIRIAGGKDRRRDRREELKVGLKVRTAGWTVG